MPRRVPTTQQVKRVYVLAPDNLARDGKQEWGAEADAQFDAWYTAAREDARQEGRSRAIEEVLDWIWDESGTTAAISRIIREHFGHEPIRNDIGDTRGN